MTEVTSKIQYAVKMTEPPVWADGLFAKNVHGDGHFSFAAEDVEGAQLFPTATEAEAKTEAGRIGTSEYGWVVVPVKVTTTSYIRPVVTETREIIS